MPTESNACFSFVISGVGTVVSQGGGGGGGVGRAAGFSLCSQNIYGLCFDVEEETTASND